MRSSILVGGRKWTLSVASLLLLLTACGGFDYDAFRNSHTVLTETDEQTPDNELAVRFLGNTNLLISDGDESILIDSFFSYPETVIPLQVTPDSKKVEAVMTAPEFSDLEAIVVTHSHHDHAMDVGEVAIRAPDANIVGSMSTRHILDGWARWKGMEPGSPAHKKLMDRFCLVHDLDNGHHKTHNTKSFTINILKGTHAENLFGRIQAIRKIKQIDKPLEPPSSIFKYAAGEIYIVHVVHKPSEQSLVIVASAGLPPEGVFKGLNADVVFLAVAAMPDDKSLYLNETVGKLDPRIVVPFHWDSQLYAPRNDKVVEPNIPYDWFARVWSGLERLREYAEEKNKKFVMLPYNKRVVISTL